MNMDDKSRITTHDLYFAAYLKAKNCQIVEIQKQGSKTIFTFDISLSGLELSKLKQGFFNNEKDEKFSVCAGIFADSIRSLKTLCHVEENRKLITPDLYFAAYLKTKNCSVETVTKNN